MFNTALNTAWINLLASLFLASPTELWPSVKDAYVPFFEFDSDKYRLVLNIDQSFVDGKTPNGKFDGLLYFNTRFYELVSGLACDRVSRVGDGNYLFTPDPKSTRSLKDEGGTTHTLYSYCPGNVQHGDVEPYSERGVLHRHAPHSLNQHEPSAHIRGHSPTTT